MDDVVKGLGAKGAVAMVGYVFDGGWAARNRDAARPLPRRHARGQGNSGRLRRRMAAARAAHRRDATPPRSRSIAQRYREGIPRRPLADEEADAQALYRVLAEIGGADWSARPRARSRHVLSRRAEENELDAAARSRSRCLIAAWFAGSQFAGPRLLPAPQAVALAIVDEARSGALVFNLGVTLARVAASFAIAMALGTVIGLAMGRSRARRPARRSLAGRAAQPAGAGDHRAGLYLGRPDRDRGDRRRRAQQAADRDRHRARRRARARPPARRDGAGVPHGRWTRLRHVVLPQLAPYLAAAARSGLSLVWKIVLIVELLGRPNGVGFEIGVAFQLFDVTRILAYALAFVAVMLAIETLLVQPLERHVSRWRPRPA